ncbi:MAG: YvcK family protein [Candidatus Omnitrophica bacterium]|nr:YvcK family protein [Candidatus Omnitrophota bacterium]
MMRKLLKWFYPGMKIKRWILFAIFGVILLSMGFVIIISEEKGRASFGTSVLIIIGIIIVVTGVKRIINSLITIFLPGTDKELVDIVYSKRQLEKGPRVVVIGGASGLSTVLRGLKEFTTNITAVITLVDEGLIATGLRDEFALARPGDIRECLIALADAEPIVGKLFNYRFKKGTELWGYNFGDLFLTAMSDITGNFDAAVKESSRVLAVRGHVVPSTLSRVSLIARHDDGTETVGKNNILNSLSPIKKVYLRPQLAKATDEAIGAIMKADAVVIAPGALYTNIAPALLIEGIREAFLKSKALKIFVLNLMTKSGETDGYKGSDHIRVINEQLGAPSIDYCVANNAPAEPLTERLRNYEQEGASLVTLDRDQMSALGCSVSEGPIVDAASPLMRHDAMKVANIIINLISESKKSKPQHAK